MRIKKRIGKIFIVLLLLFCTIVCSLGNTAAIETTGNSMDVVLKDGGKTKVTLTVSSEKMEKYDVEDIEDFKLFFSEYVEILNGSSEDVDVLKIVSYSAYNEGYSVTLSTRRIDKIGGLGEIYYRSGKTFSTFTQNMTKIEDYYDSVSDKVTTTLYPRDASDKTQVTHKFKLKGESIEASRIKNGNAEVVSYESFNEYLSGTKDKIVTFKAANFVFADSIVIRLNGKIKYVSSSCVEVLDKNTVKLVPIQAMDSETGETLSLYLGYFTYKANLSGIFIGLIALGITALAVLIFCCVKFRWLGRLKNSGILKQMKKFRLLYLMIFPAFIVLVLFHYLPLGGLVTAFQKYDIFDGYSSEFVGLKNFRNIFYSLTSDKMYQIFRNTIFISLIRIVTNFPIILLLALVVYSIKNRGVRTVFQALSFIPYFISWAAVGGMAFAMLDSNAGMLNNVLNRFGFESVRWYSTPEPWWAILAITSLWKGMGWGTLIYISAMCNIDSELYEACAIDGGGVFRQAMTVTIPSIMNVICLQLILDTGNIMKDNYEQILALVPGDTSKLDSMIEVIGKYTYSQLNGSGMGSATAMGLIQSVIGVILVLVTNKIVKKTDNEGIL